MPAVILFHSLSGKPSDQSVRKTDSSFKRQNPGCRIWSSGLTLQAEQLLINNRTRQDDHHGHLKGTQEGHRGAQSASSLGDDSGEVHEDLANLNRPLSSSSCSGSPPQHWQFHSLLGSKWSQIKRTVGKFLSCSMSLPCSLCRVAGTLLIGDFVFFLGIF